MSRLAYHPSVLLNILLYVVERSENVRCWKRMRTATKQNVCSKNTRSQPTVLKKCWLTCTTPAVHSEKTVKPLALALTRMSFTDFPLRYDRRGGSLKILLCCGWFCIKCHFPMSISFNLSNAGWYCLTKGRMCNYFLLCGSVFILRWCFYLRKFVFWLMFFYSHSRVASIFKACPEVSYVFLKRILWGVSF